MEDHMEHKEKLHRRHGKKAAIFLVHPKIALEEKVVETCLILNIKP